MNLTRSQKQLAVVLAIALTGLAIDRFAFTPSDASATPTDLLVAREPASPTPTAAPNADPTAAVGTTPRPTAATWGARAVSARLQDIATKEGLLTDQGWSGRDPFHTKRQVQVQATAPETAPTPKRNLAREAAEAFAARHQLRATMGSGARGMVLISDRMVRLGEGLEGWRLVAMDNTSATFEKDGMQVRFPLSDPPNEQGPR